MIDNNHQLNTFKFSDKDKEREEKPSDNGVKNSMNLMKYIENGSVEDVNNLLENESISKHTLSACLSKALLNYRSNSDMIDIINSLLKYIIYLP